MRVVHLADLHIGFRAYTRVAPSGLNQREVDVAGTFAAVIDRVIAVEPDLVAIAGDVFHHARPSPAATLTAFTGFKRLMDALPSCIVVCVAGNHDISLTNDSGDMLPLLTTLGVHVVNRSAQRLYFADRDLSVLGVPDAPGLVRPALAPDPRARLNVLVLHGEVQGITQGGAAHRVLANEVTRDELGADAWTYCAFGHYHQHEQLAPNACYAGSIDYTSSNIWQEIATPKGFVERDLETGAQTFHAVPPERPVLDLPRVDVTDMTPEQANAAIAATMNAQSIDGAIVRLVVDGATRAIRKDVDHKAMRSWRKRAMAFTMTMDVVAEVGPLSVALHDRNLTRETIDQLIGRKLKGYDVSAGVDRGEFETMAQHYLGLAKEKSAQRDPSEPVSIEAVAEPQRRSA